LLRYFASYKSVTHRTAGVAGQRCLPIFKSETKLFTPLRYQATEADCYPTSVVNALVWLFERHELPGATLQHIYAYCLDGIESGVAGSYTTEHAGLALVDWLGNFRTRSFAVMTDMVNGDDLHLRRSSKILRWLQRGGVAIVDVIETAATTHSILALSAGADHLDFWDPYLRVANYDYGRDALRLATDGHSPNLSLSRSALDSPRIRRYSFGPPSKRAGVLIRRTTRGRRRASGRPS
jgi:hypothetical protein